MLKQTNTLLLGLTVVLFSASDATAITIGQIDDFQDGTTQGWTAGGAATIPTTNSTDNGPLGIGDHALLLATTGAPGGPSSKLVAFNPAQWSGDYTAEGVTNISLEARNLSGRDVTVRLAAEGGGGAFSTITGYLLPANSGWQSLSFDIAPIDWTTVAGGGAVAPGTNIAATLSSMNTLRIVDSAVPSFTGDTGAGELLIDNIQAVPEPGTISMAMLLGALGLRCRRRSV